MVKNYRLSTERLHLFIPNNNIIMKVSIGGRPDITLLKDAIGSAVKVNESLNCKVVLLEDGSAEYKRINKPVYSLKVSSKPFEEIIRGEEGKIFNLQLGEMIRFFITTSVEDDTQLIIIAHHLAGDGLSIVYLIEDIMNALSKQKLKFKPLHILSVDKLPKKSEISPILKIFLKRLNKKWSENGKVFSYYHYEKIFTDYWKSHKTYLCLETLTKNQLELLYEKSKEWKVSINSIMTAAFIRAYGKKANTGLAVSIKEKGCHDLSNSVTRVGFEYKYNKDKGFAKNAQNVHKYIYKNLKNDKKKYLPVRFMAMMEGALIDSACMTKYGKYKNKEAKYCAHLMGYVGSSRDLSMSNLTKLDIKERYGEYTISDFVFVAPIVPNATRVLGIATLGEEANITMHIMDDENIKREKELFNKFIEILKNITNLDYRL